MSTSEMMLKIQFGVNIPMWCISDVTYIIEKAGYPTSIQVQDNNCLLRYNKGYIRVYDINFYHYKYDSTKGSLTNDINKAIKDI